MKIVTSEEMRRIDEEAVARGVATATLMENAGRATAEACGLKMDLSDRKVLVLVGPGNNGGDGLVAARYLHEMGAAVYVYVGKRLVEGDENYRRVQELEIPVFWHEEDEGGEKLRKLARQADVVVDALLGTGVTKPVTGAIKEMLSTVGPLIARRRERSADLTPGGTLHPVASLDRAAPPPGPLVVAVDMPSGLNADNGALDPATLAADLTVTFAFPKPGHFLAPGAWTVGELVVADISIPPNLADEVKLEMAEPELVRSLLPERPPYAHKGTFGKALLVSGSVNYTGAAYLAATAATRVGCGLVTLAPPQPLYPILAAKISEATWLLLPHDMGVISAGAIKVLEEELGNYDALLVGPGLGCEKATVEFVSGFLSAAEAPHKKGHMGFLLQKEEAGERAEKEASPLPPLVLDADALNILSELPDWWKLLPPESILTPHPGEMARLVGCSVKEVEADRLGAVREMAARWGQVVVLKGAYTLVAAPDGRVCVMPFANPGLATAGSGDVLAGAIVGFRAQGLDPYQAALAGAYVHGQAGEMARRELGETGTVAGDLLPRLPLVIKALRGR
jgi:hydroxyethylthiazole kinase-like uncharacterized protein yjeF